jgi:hypothetical protein
VGGGGRQLAGKRLRISFLNLMNRDNLLPGGQSVYRSMKTVDHEADCNVYLKKYIIPQSLHGRLQAENCGLKKNP